MYLSSITWFPQVFQIMTFAEFKPPHSYVYKQGTFCFITKPLQTNANKRLISKKYSNFCILTFCVFL